MNRKKPWVLAAALQLPSSSVPPTCPGATSGAELAIPSEGWGPWTETHSLAPTWISFQIRGGPGSVALPPLVRSPPSKRTPGNLGKGAERACRPPPLPSLPEPPCSGLPLPSNQPLSQAQTFWRRLLVSKPSKRGLRGVPILAAPCVTLGQCPDL